MQRIGDRYTGPNHSEAFKAYRDRKYAKYGYSLSNPILYNPECNPDKLTANHYRFVENVSDGLRFIGKAHDIIRLDHTGYYVDNYQGETVHGVVYMLPSRNHKPQYIPGVNDPCNDNCALLDFHSITDEEVDAARQADGMAEYHAEECREYVAKDEAENRIENNKEEMTELYASFRTLCREIRANCDKLTGMPEVQSLIKAEWVRTKASISALRADTEKVQAEGIQYW